MNNKYIITKHCFGRTSWFGNDQSLVLYWPDIEILFDLKSNQKLPLAFQLSIPASEDRVRKFGGYIHNCKISDWSSHWATVDLGRFSIQLSFDSLRILDAPRQVGSEFTLSVDLDPECENVRKERGDLTRKSKPWKR